MLKLLSGYAPLQQLNILMKQKKTLHQSGGNFLLSEVKVLQGDKVMFDQQILMNTEKKNWITNHYFVIVSKLKIIWKLRE